MVAPATLRMYQIDAFADRIFSGNPAAVCPLETWLPDATLQAIAAENNLPATAFFAPEGSGYRLRWFTPVTELELCGHGTLASADVVFRVLRCAETSISFITRSGTLTVVHENGVYAMDFPATTPAPCPVSPAIVEGLGVVPVETLRGFDHVVVLDTEAEIRALRPIFSAWADLDLRGVCVTAPGDHVDFVSRFFLLRHAAPEDPATGSTHCELTPYWAKRLNKTSLRALQVSPRGGAMSCDLHGDRVIIRGRAAHYMTADIMVG